MTLTPKELEAKDYLEKQFVPILHHVLETASPLKYMQWGGNACRQTAILGHFIISKLLPMYKWTAWDGIFNDKLYGKNVNYNHAWLYGEHKRENRCLLVDLSRKHQERLFILVEENKYPSDHPEYKYTQLINKTKIDVQKQLQIDEYYTSLKGNQLLWMIETLIRSKEEKNE